MQPQPPQQMWPPQPWGSGPPVTPPAARRRRVASIAAAVLAATLAAGGTGYAIGRHHSAPTPPTATAPAEADALSPAAATTRVCDALKAGYPAVVEAIDEDNAFRSAPWSDPNLLAAVNRFVTVATAFADRLEASLSQSTPPELRSAVIEYVAGLRAFSISERDHAPDSQINGTLQLYKQVRHPVLRLCGLPE